MSTTCCGLERSFGFQVTNVSTAGVAAPINDGSGEGNVYSVIDVTNDTDKDIKVEYRSTDAKVCFFIVPKSVRVKGRRLTSGNLENTSLKLYAIGSAAIGVVTINVGS